MSGDTLIKFCSPTLAGLKTSNLFTCQVISIKKLIQNINYLNNILNKKGIFVEILSLSDDRALVFVFRKEELQNILLKNKIQEFLSDYGYNDFDVISCINLLKFKLTKNEFPHEIGVFLGYPLQDIKSFIKNKGANFKFVGYWKVYTNEEYAEKLFNKFNKCKKLYCQRYQEGFDISRLAVAK